MVNYKENEKLISKEGERERERERERDENNNNNKGRQSVYGNR